MVPVRVGIRISEVPPANHRPMRRAYLQVGVRGGSAALLSSSAATRVTQLEVGAWGLPHPRKTNGGEDASFISQASRHGVPGAAATFGVADGISAANDGGEYARKLLDATAELCRDSTCPRELLHSAWLSVRDGVYGRSTACIASVDQFEGESRLRLANLGDSGCWVLRRRQSTRLSVAFSTTPQLWEFNCPYQLGTLEGVELNTPTDALTSSFTLLPGDVVLVATDGLFDAMHALEILELTHRELGNHRTASQTARTLVETAIDLSKDSSRASPVMQAFEREGYVARGRELQDDVTAVVAKVL